MSSRRTRHPPSSWLPTEDPGSLKITHGSPSKIMGYAPIDQRPGMLSLAATRQGLFTGPSDSASAAERAGRASQLAESTRERAAGQI